MPDHEIRELIASIQARLDAGLIRNQDLARGVIASFQWILDQREKHRLFYEYMHQPARRGYGD